MNILIINQILYTHADGVIPKMTTIKDTMIYQMCRGFMSLGYAVTLAAASEYRPIENEQYDFDVKWFDSDYSKLLPPTLLPYSRGLKKYLRNEGQQYDLIITKEVFSFSSLWAVKYCSRKTVLWVEQAYHQHKFCQIPSKIWFGIIARYYMRKVLAVVPCSKGARDFLKSYFKNVSEEIVEHGIDIDKFVPSRNKKRQLMVSSQLIKRKNIDSILEKFCVFHSQMSYSDIKLYIAGRGPEEIPLKEKVRQLGIEDSVVFLGFLSQKELNEYNSQSLAFLINTRSDLNMVSVPESICSGTPVIMNGVPLTSWYVKEYNLGVVKDNWDYMDINRVIEENEIYVRNCINYRDHLSIRTSAKKLIRISGIKEQ